MFKCTFAFNPLNANPINRNSIALKLFFELGVHALFSNTKAQTLTLYNMHISYTKIK